jgi:TrmH family RNA methyltransferase
MYYIRYSCQNNIIMIPLFKFIELPRTLRLRKALSLFGEAERRFIITNRLEKEKAEHLCRIAELLANDEKFSVAAVAALEAAQTNLTDADGKDIRRSLNTVYHLLLAETGRPQSDWDFIEASGALDLSRRRSFIGMQVYFEDIRSPFNVGSMFRAAESFGVEKVWLSPLCADPRHKRAERSAMGCVDIIPWERLSHDPFNQQDEDNQGALFLFDYPVFALETGGVPLDDFSFPPRGILTVGSEELGVSPRMLAAADASLGRVTIPTWGVKGSLNVSVAFGIVMHTWAAKIANDR